MTLPGEARRLAADLAAAARDAADPERARLFVYSVCLIISFCLYLFVHGWGRGGVFWALAALALAGLVAGTVLADFGRQAPVLRGAAILAVGLAVLVPIVPQMAASGSMAAAMAGSTVWPQILVALFGGRVLADLAELQFTQLWRHPFEARRTVPVQSIAAALSLGAFFTLLFYQAASYCGGRGTSSSGIIVSALLGDTVIHHTIVFLFFVILACVVDATLLYLRDRSAVAAIRTLARARSGVGSADLRQLLDTELAPWSHTRAVRLIRDTLDVARPGSIPSPAAPSALAGFHQASRRFIRGLIPLLPLLGFLGTVVGLTMALAELPNSLASGQRETFNIGGSLAGLAVQFETTFLGLLGSMILSVPLGLLEKSETELAAECVLLVEAAQMRDRRDAV